MPYLILADALGAFEELCFAVMLLGGSELSTPPSIPWTVGSSSPSNAAIFCEIRDGSDGVGPPPVIKYKPCLYLYILQKYLDQKVLI